MTVRLNPNCSQSVGSVGITSPSPSAPPMIWWLNSSTTTAANRAGRHWHFRPDANAPRSSPGVRCSPHDSSYGLTMTTASADCPSTKQAGASGRLRRFEMIDVGAMNACQRSFAGSCSRRANAVGRSSQSTRWKRSRPLRQIHQSRIPARRCASVGHRVSARAPGRTHLPGRLRTECRATYAINRE